MRDFRRLPDAGNAEYTPELTLAIRRARFRREIAVELAGELELEVPRLHFDPRPFAGDGNRLADAARKLLNVTLNEQLHWRDKYEALNAWSAAVMFLRGPKPLATVTNAVGDEGGFDSIG